MEARGIDKFTPEQMCQRDAGYWAYFNKIRLGNRVFTFEGHEYQVGMFKDKTRVQVDIKGAQGGMTGVQAMKSVHGMIMGRYKDGVLYLFPTADDVTDFTRSRFDPLIKQNHKAIGRYVKNTNNVSLKNICGSFLYMRGATLPKNIDDHKEASKLRSIPVNRVVYDECDLMDPEVFGKARERMGHSEIDGVKGAYEEHYLSNPTVPGYGISEMFDKSDQKHWFRKCESCSHWTCAELSFPECVKEKDGKGYIACSHCGRPVGIYPGQWIPSVKDAEISGRRWSQLTSAFVDPLSVLIAYNDPPQGNLGDVYRFKLGLPYVAAEDRLTEASVFGCCGNYLPLSSHVGPCAMGVDVGKDKHVIIGAKTGKDRYEIFKTIRLSKWEDIHDIAQRFNVRSAVVDIRPYEDKAREFQNSERYPVFLCQYVENSPSGEVYDEKHGIVKAARTEILDATHRLVTTPGMLTIPRFCDEIKIFAKQLCDPFKILEKDKKTGVQVYRYKGKNDHYRHALNYFLLAAKTTRIGYVKDSIYKKSRPKFAKNDYSRI